MTDSYLQPEVHIIVTQMPGVDGVASPARLTQIETDLADMLARPNVQGIGDLNDVTITSPTTGQVIALNSGGEWVNSSGSFGTIDQVRDDNQAVSNVNFIWARRGVKIETNASFPQLAYIEPNYGTAAWTVAQGNHTHPIYPDTVLPFAASGTLTSGTRTLVSGTVSGLEPDRQYRIRATLLLHARGDGTGASFVMSRVTINGVNRNNFEDSRLVAGVMITEPNLYPSAGASITGVSSVAVSAAAIYQSGDPAYIGGGMLVIQVESNR